MQVDQAFTLEAGRQIWGYPKIMADFTVRDGNPFGFDVSVDGALIVKMAFGRGVPVPMPSRPQSLLTYTNLEGTTRETAAEQRSSGFRARIGGAKPSGWAITRSPRNSRRWDCPSARCCPCRSPTST